MGHRLFPVPSNFPVPGHQVRHSPPAAVKCLSASRPVDMARKITWCLREKKKKKPCGNPKSERCLDWFMQPVREDMSTAALDRVGAGRWATRGRDDGLVCCWCDDGRVGCVCLAETARRSRQQRWERQPSLAWSGATADHMAAACHTSPSVAVYPLIHSVLHQLMGPWKRCPRKAPQPPPCYRREAERCSERAPLVAPWRQSENRC